MKGGAVVSFILAAGRSPQLGCGDTAQGKPSPVAAGPRHCFQLVWKQEGRGSSLPAGRSSPPHHPGDIAVPLESPAQCQGSLPALSPGLPKNSLPRPQPSLAYGYVLEGCSLVILVKHLPASGNQRLSGCLNSTAFLLKSWCSWLKAD